MKITEQTDSFVIRYPQAEEFTKKQLSIFWLPDEIKVEKDVHDILTNFTEAEKHGVLTVLKLFSLYELFAGRDYWGKIVMENFPRPEILRMASVFSMFELAVHQPFYDKINQVLGLSTDEFYSSYAKDQILKERIEVLEYAANSGGLPQQLLVFSLLEGVVLYSSFAFLKHFQSQGKNKLLNIVRGINFSVRDEDLHAQAGAWLYNEYGVRLPQKDVIQYVDLLREHEHRIIDMIFEKGDIPGINKDDLKAFVEHRIHLCLNRLGYEYPDTPSSIKEWFYKGISDYIMNDFFSGLGREYSRTWEETGFIWK